MHVMSMISGPIPDELPVSFDICATLSPIQINALQEKHKVLQNQPSLMINHLFVVQTTRQNSIIIYLWLF